MITDSARASARCAKFAERCVSDVLSVMGVAPVDERVVREALALGWANFDDAVCVRTAVTSGCHLLATRDPQGSVVRPCLSSTQGALSA